MEEIAIEVLKDAPVAVALIVVVIAFLRENRAMHDVIERNTRVVEALRGFLQRDEP